jgi:hypothetical protein
MGLDKAETRANRERMAALLSAFSEEARQEIAVSAPELDPRAELKRVSG